MMEYTTLGKTGLRISRMGFGGIPIQKVDAARTRELMEALVERVRNHERYEGVTDVFALAALYCVAIARGHAFLDANKRTAVNCTWAFLKMNGVKASVPENLVETVIRTATGEMDAQKAAEYLRAAFGEK